MASSSSFGNSKPSPPPSAGKKSFLRRVVPVLLVANVAVGVYVLIRTSKKEPHQKDGETTEKNSSTPAAVTSLAVPEKAVLSETIAPVKVRPPIPEQEQRQLFKWILEETRKVKPQNALEKKKIDEEKTLLKELIRAKSIPSL